MVNLKLEFPRLRLRLGGKGSHDLCRVDLQLLLPA